MKETVKLAIALGIICLVASASLAYVKESTKAKKEQTDNAIRQDALKKVLPDFDNDPFQEKVEFGEEGSKIIFYRATKGGVLVGYAGEGAATGFGGPVKTLVGINADNSIRNVVITGHTETPGLGTQVTDRNAVKSIWTLFGAKPSASKQKYHLDQYNGKTALDGSFEVGKDIQAISGATISSKAVASAVTIICEQLSPALDAFKELDKE